MGQTSANHFQGNPLGETEQPVQQQDSSSGDAHQGIDMAGTRVEHAVCTGGNVVNMTMAHCTCTAQLSMLSAA